MSTQWDEVVIGGGHNGLVCAAYLARAGRKVLVLERRDVLGGAAVSEEVLPGFTFSVASYVVSLFRPRIIQELELTKYGYHVIPMDCAFQPLHDNHGLARWEDPERTRIEMSRYSSHDAENYPKFKKTMTRLGRVAAQIIDRPAPTGVNPQNLRTLIDLFRTVRGVEKHEFQQLVRLLTLSAVDFLDTWFESEILKAPLAASGIIGTFQGVRSPGTAYVLLHHYMGEIDGAFRSWGFARGGTGSVSTACARAAEAHGAVIRTNCEVDKVLVSNSRSTGVVLSNGDVINARRIVSNLDPRRTLMGLVGESHLPESVVSSLAHFRYRGSSGKVNLALDGLPDFTCRPGIGDHLRGDIAIAPNVDYLERAFDEAKYGSFSSRPFINIVIPSLTDPTIAPPGKHVMSCFVQYAPYELTEGPEAWESQREAFGKTVLDTLEEFAPGLRNHIEHMQVLTPLDLERKFGLTEGNIFHGELSLNQLLFQRPAWGMARYQTPIRDLWMCGSGTHPGGGVMGASGELAAKTLLRKKI